MNAVEVLKKSGNANKGKKSNRGWTIKDLLFETRSLKTKRVKKTSMIIFSGNFSRKEDEEKERSERSIKRKRQTANEKMKEKDKWYELEKDQ